MALVQVLKVDPESIEYLNPMVSSTDRTPSLLSTTTSQLKPPARAWDCW